MGMITIAVTALTLCIDLDVKRNMYELRFYLFTRMNWTKEMPIASNVSTRRQTLCVNNVATLIVTAVSAARMLVEESLNTQQLLGKKLRLLGKSFGMKMKEEPCTIILKHVNAHSKSLLPCCGARRKWHGKKSTIQLLRRRKPQQKKLLKCKDRWLKCKTKWPVCQRDAQG